MIKSIDSIRDGVVYLREKGVQRGEDTGFKCLDELYSIKQGSFTIVQGAPTHGKSEFIFEMLLNQAFKYGKKSNVLSPETGTAEEIAMELIHKYLGKTAYSTNPYSCNEKEFFAALAWVNHHFAIADDQDKSYSFDGLTEAIDKFEKDNKTEYELVMAEPWNELDHKLSLVANFGRQDLSIEDEMNSIRRYCKNRNKHIFLSFHPSFQELVHDKTTGIDYYKMPKAREAAGGQATLRKAFSWINIWRPPVGMVDPWTNEPYRENELQIQVEKSKPKGIGKKGITKVFLDWKKSRYYEELFGSNKYAFEHEAKFDIHNPMAGMSGNLGF